jgi:hypothetical protein
MTYKPKYAEGQILVIFEGECNKLHAEYFGERLGYELDDEEYKHGDAYIFKTEAGKEKEAIEKFMAHPEFIDSAELRDIKMEERFSKLEKLLDMVQELHNDVELPDDQYNQRLGDIKHYLKS